MSHLTSLFITILNMSITASYVAAGVMLIRMLLRRAPKVYAYMLWSAVLFRMVTPITITAGISLLGLLHGDTQASGGQIHYIPQQIGTMEHPQIQTGSGGLMDDSVNESLPEPQVVQSVNDLQMIAEMAGWIWAAGVIGLLLYNTISYCRLSRKVSTAIRVQDRVFESEHVQAPFVLGIWRPRIYVPTGLGQGELKHIVAHEEMHIRRRDYQIKPIAYLAVLIHWFNPLMWLSFSLMCKDMEMSCDEAAMRRIGLDARSRKAYSHTLLSLSMPKRLSFRGIKLSFGENHISSRIKNVLQFKKPRPRVAAVAAAVVVIGVIALVVNPGSASPQENAINGANRYQIDELLANQTEYIGNNSKVVALIESLSAGLGMKRGEISLQTKKEPYELSIHYQLKQGQEATDQMEEAKLELYRNSAVLFSLISNAGKINVVIDYDQLTFTRQQVEAAFGQDVRLYAEDRESFAKYLEQVSRLFLPSPD